MMTTQEPDQASALWELHTWPARVWLFREDSRLRRHPEVEAVPDYLGGPPDWQALFGGRAGPLEVEIGCGKGTFLVRAGGERPGHRILGIERARQYVQESCARVRKAELPNVRVVWAEALPFLRGALEPGSVHAFHVYFPDPWPKKRHHKRRFFTILEAFAATPGFRRVPWDEPAEPLTAFERKYRQQGRTIHRACFEKGAGPFPTRERVRTPSRPPCPEAPDGQH
jgi:hypothetical protein